MRLKTYLNEAPDEFSHWWNMILKDCKPFLKELKRNQYTDVTKNYSLLFRGAQKTDKISIRKVRTDRWSKDTPPENHKYLDKIFKEKFGWNARSNGLFCTGDIKTTTEYGVTHAIFPIGKFKIIWSDDINDLWSDVLDSWRDEHHLKLREEPDEDLIDEWLDVWNDDFNNPYNENGNWLVDGKIFDKHTFWEKADLIDYLNNKEYNWHIVEWQPQYTEDEYIKLQTKTWEKERSDTVKWLLNRYTDKYLVDSITSGNEIMVNCKSYYSIPLKYFEKELQREWDNRKSWG